jgi:hypothetical protein
MLTDPYLTGSVTDEAGVRYRRLAYLHAASDSRQHPCLPRRTLRRGVRTAPTEVARADPLNHFSDFGIAQGNRDISR